MSKGFYVTYLRKEITSGDRADVWERTYGVSITAASADDEVEVSSRGSLLNVIDKARGYVIFICS